MSSHYRGHLAMLFFSALVAGSFSLGSMVANDIAPMALNAVRFVIAAVVIGIAAQLTHGLRRKDFRAPWRFIVLGALFAIYFVLMFYGLQTAAPVSTAAVFTLTPVLTAVFGWVLLRQATTGRMALALSIGAIGAIWVIFRGDPEAIWAFETGRGEMIYFLGCVAHALYTPMVRLLNRGEPAVVFTFGMLVAGAMILLAVGWSDIRATDWAGLSPLVWLVLLYVALIASAATFVLLQYATLHLPSAKVMAYTYLTPSWVMLWEIALGRPAPSAVVVLGILCTCWALWLLLRDDSVPLTATQSG
ncbi:DMT family transporter [Phaeobacter sp. C3_T13_0]|uniref:DMT family transporter n=1 Tax=Phaeobacter cretensis TaxID=3342641 RepID=UPI0039BD24FB